MKKLKSFATVPLLAASVSLCYSAAALSVLPVRTVYENQAQGLEGSIIELLVAPGYGANINVAPTGAVVKRAWLDDPTRIAISFDGSLCPTGVDQSGEQQSGQGACANAGATVIHLKQIKRIDFPNLLSSDSGTLLSLVADGPDGRKLYQFRVIPTDKEASYTTVTIRPESDRPTPLIFNSPAPQQTPSPAPSSVYENLDNSKEAPVIP